jgi:elongation factor 3
MPEIVPKATEALGNARQAVKDAAAAAMTACMQTVNNKDLEQFIPMLIDTMQNPVKVPDCVHKLAATTFVQVSLLLAEGACLMGRPPPSDG